jgi:hypothetical protein
MIVSTLFGAAAWRKRHLLDGITALMPGTKRLTKAQARAGPHSGQEKIEI